MEKIKEEIEDNHNPSIKEIDQEISEIHIEIESLDTELTQEKSRLEEIRENNNKQKAYLSQEIEELKLKEENALKLKTLVDEILNRYQKITANWEYMKDDELDREIGILKTYRKKLKREREEEKESNSEHPSSSANTDRMGDLYCTHCSGRLASWRHNAKQGEDVCSDCHRADSRSDSNYEEINPVNADPDFIESLGSHN